MPSKASEANKRHYEAAAASGPQSPADTIAYHDVHWTGLTAEPGSVDYLEIEAGGARALWVVPARRTDDRVLLYSHGGGFVSGSIYTHRKLVGHLAKAVGCRALVYDTAYAHEHKYPHQLDTAVSVYRWLLAQRIEPAHVAFAGDSAGAILALGVLQRARAEHLPFPAAVALMSPWLDMTASSASFETNRAKDTFFTRQSVQWLASNFLGDLDPRDPPASAIFADLSGFPPMFLQAGGDEALVDESRAMADRAKQAGVEVRLDVIPGMLHSFQMMAGRAPEADDAIRALAAWLRPKLGIAG